MLQLHENHVVIDDDLYLMGLLSEARTARWKGQFGHVDVWQTEGCLWLHHELLEHAFGVLLPPAGQLKAIKTSDPLMDVLEKLFVGGVPWAWLREFGLYPIGTVS